MCVCVFVCALSVETSLCYYQPCLFIIIFFIHPDTSYTVDVTVKTRLDGGNKSCIYLLHGVVCVLIWNDCAAHKGFKMDMTIQSSQTARKLFWLYMLKFMS